MRVDELVKSHREDQPNFILMLILRALGSSFDRVLKIPVVIMASLDLDICVEIHFGTWEHICTCLPEKNILACQKKLNKKLARTYRCSMCTGQVSRETDIFL